MNKVMNKLFRIIDKYIDEYSIKDFTYPSQPKTIIILQMPKFSLIHPEKNIPIFTSIISIHHQNQSILNILNPNSQPPTPNPQPP